jgi:hypothetical protein
MISLILSFTTKMKHCLIVVIPPHKLNVSCHMCLYVTLNSVEH